MQAGTEAGAVPSDSSRRKGSLMRNLALLVVAASIAAGPRPLAPPTQQAEGVQRDVVVGVAKYYDQYSFEQVLRNRGMVRPPGYAGLASVPFCHMIGSTVEVSLYNPVKGMWGSWARYYVVDCSRPGADQRRHLCLGQPKGCVPLVVEVDRATAQRAQFAREGKTAARVVYGDGHYIGD